jgi:hypothetical protein
MYWYFFGGGSGAVDAGALTPATVEELGDRIGIVVEDAGRAEAAQLILDHAADRAEIEAVLDQLNRDWERGQERVLDLRFELRDQLTREEWVALYSPD